MIIKQRMGVKPNHENLTFNGAKAIFDENGKVKALIVELGEYEGVYINWNSETLENNFTIADLCRELGLTNLDETAPHKSLNEKAGAKVNAYMIESADGMYTNIRFGVKKEPKKVKAITK